MAEQNALNVIVDISGSMYTAGKPSAVGMVLQTLSADETFSVSKLKWDGSKESFAELCKKVSAQKTLVLTDGYALYDSCRQGFADFFAANKENLFVVLCGGDCIAVGKFKEFRNVAAVRAENILFALETLAHQADAQSDEGGEDWE